MNIESAGALQCGGPVLETVSSPQDRVRSLIEYLDNGRWMKESDADLGGRFGLTAKEVATERRKAGYLRPRGNGGNHKNRKVSFSDLGQRDEVLFVLTRGGKCVSDLVRERLGGRVTHQRCSQMLEKMRIRDVEGKRNTLWYANRLVGGQKEREADAKILASFRFLRKALRVAGSTTAYAAKLGVSSDGLTSFMRRIHGLDRNGYLIADYGKKTKLYCPQCGKPFFRPKRSVERERRESPGKAFLCSNKCKALYARGRKLRRRHRTR